MKQVTTAAIIAMTITAFFLTKPPTWRCKCMWCVALTPLSANNHIIVESKGFVK